jgi:hypothetical protein
LKPEAPLHDKQDRQKLAKLGAHEKWLRVKDRSQATEPARRAFDDKFVREVKERFGDDLPSDELAFRVEHARKAYYTRPQLASMRSRRKKKGRAEKSSVDAKNADPESRRSSKRSRPDRDLRAV